jgi:Na+/H+ antiporter
MVDFQTIVILLFFAAILVGIAQKTHMPYPIALVIGGIALGFIPGLRAISFDPNVLLVVVLPPILYYAAFGISFREFKSNFQEIFSLALGLVILTTLVIGVIFKWLFPQFPWALAFAFGAIVSPTDAVSATTIMKRFAIRPRLLAVIEGESLINDASGLLLYRIAVATILSGAFSLWSASWEFFKIATGGSLVGCALGFPLQYLSRRFLDPVVGVLFSITIPYVTYIAADTLGVSGVLAVVVNGLIGSRVLATHHSSLRRVIGFAFWDIFNILMNSFIFILIGLELRQLIHDMPPQAIALYTAYAFLITFALIVIRFLWVYAKRGLTDGHAAQERAIISWSGMRGIVSLTAALALPSNLGGRAEVIFITFIVLLLTLLLPSSTLAYFIRFMNMDHTIDHHTAHRARKRLVEVVHEKLRQLLEIGSISNKEFTFLSSYFSVQRYVFDISSSPLKKMSIIEKARREVFHAERSALVAMWESQEIDDKLFRQLEHELDVEESLTTRAELK